MLIGISAAVIAASIVVFIAYAIQAMRSVTVSMAKTQLTLELIQGQLEKTGEEASRLLQTSQIVAQDVKGKLMAIDTLFSSAREAGHVVNEITRSAKDAIASTVQSSGEKHSLLEWLEWAASGFSYLQSRHSRRHAQQSCNDAATKVKGVDKHVG